VQDALRADVVVLAIPFDSVSGSRSRQPMGGRIAVDATNAIQFPSFTPRIWRADVDRCRRRGDSWGARVKAFNPLPGGSLAADPAQHGGRRVIFFRGTRKAQTPRSLR